MAIFKLYDCDAGITIDGVNYDFEHVENVQIEDPEQTRLIRGANAGNKTGIIYKEGIKEPKKLTMTVLGIPKELHDLLKQVYADKKRVDCYVISRADGSNKTAKNAVLTQAPKQLTVDDTADSMNTALIFESFDVDEVHKS